MNEYWSKLHRGSKISSSSAAIGILAFFMPWILISCGNSQTTLSGYDLATGGAISLGFDIQTYDATASLWLFIIVCIAALAIAYRYIQRRKIDNGYRYGFIVAGVAGVLLYLNELSEIGNASNEAMTKGIFVDVQYGFSLTGLAMFGIAVGGFLNAADFKNYKSRRQQKTKS